MIRFVNREMAWESTRVPRRYALGNKQHGNESTIMFVLESYPLAILFCAITMLCWGSWANTQKLAAKTWRFELFYWDYVIGVLALALIFAFTLGSFGEGGKDSYPQSSAGAAAFRRPARPVGCDHAQRDRSGNPR